MEATTTIINTELNTPVRVIDEDTKEEVILTVVKNGDDIEILFEHPENFTILKDVLYKVAT